jgi:hypothetical protein
MPAQEKMPSTIRRSSAKAQRTWAKTYDSAVEQYGDGRRASQTAMASLKHSFQKIGGRSRMSKPALVDAIPAANRRATERKQTSRRRGG